MYGRTSLHKAILKGCDHETVTLIEEGADPYERDDFGNSALHYACLKLEVGIVDKLLDIVDDVNIQNNAGETPWHCVTLGYYSVKTRAVPIGQSCHVNEICNKAKEKMCNVNRNVKVKCCDVETRRDSIIKKLFDRNVNVNITDFKGCTVLHIAVLKGLNKRASSLIDCNMDIDIKDTSGNSALHYACLKLQPKLVEKLIKKCVDIDSQNHKGQTPLHVATLTRTSDPNNTFYSDNVVKIEVIVGKLLSNNAQVNKTDNDGRTALHYAVLNNFDGVLDLLIKNCALVNFKDNNGNTPLHFACLDVKKDVAWKLLQGNADVNMKNNDGDTPLHCICSTSTQEKTWKLKMYKESMIISLVATLLAKKAYVNATNHSLETALHIVCKIIPIPDLVRMLIAYGAKVNLKTIDGKTALHFVCSGICSEYAHLRRPNYGEVISCLLTSNCDVDIKDNDGKTPLFHANQSFLNCTCISPSSYAIHSYVSKVFTELILRDSSYQSTSQDNQCSTIHRLTGLKIGKLLQHWRNTVKNIVSLTQIQSTIPWKRDTLDDVLIPLQCINLIVDRHESIDVPGIRQHRRASHLESICKQELELLKDQVFGQHTLYSIFKDYQNPLYVFEDRIEQVIKNPSLCTKYPIYSTVLKTKYAMAKKRHALMVQVTNKPLIKDLPKEIVWKILTYIVDKDLKSACLAVGEEAYVQ